MTSQSHLVFQHSTSMECFRKQSSLVAALFHNTFADRIHYRLRGSHLVLFKTSVRSSADGNPTNTNTNANTRIIKIFRNLQIKLDARIQQLRKNLPIKTLFFLIGFYSATAFSTVIGQTGDWDILSAALAVVVVEAIGALMYTTQSQPPFFNRIRTLIVMFNYWKAGLSLGLFLDSFKY